MALKGIIWDFDGVILDSFQDQFEWFRKICGIYGKPFVYNNPEDFRRDYTEPVCPGMYNLLGFDWENERDVLWEHYHEHKRHAVLKIVKGIDFVIKEIENYGLRQCIASSNAHEGIEKRLDESGLRKYFPVIVAKEDLPLENNEPRYKPYPDCLLMCMQRLGLNPNECAYIGDQASDIMAARNVQNIAGSHLPVIAVAYGFGTWHRLKKAKPDYPKDAPIETSGELLETIRRLL